MNYPSQNRRVFLKRTSSAVILAGLGSSLITRKASATDWVGGEAWDDCLNHLRVNHPYDTRALNDFENQKNQSGYTCSQAAHEFAVSCDRQGRTVAQVENEIENDCCAA